MSNRTIVEINHDYAREIRQRPELFVKLLGAALSSGAPDSWEELERFGIRFGVSCHHSDKRSVNTKYRTVEF